jgi:5-methylcytosine-specific restriction endonuclease McrA
MKCAVDAVQKRRDKIKQLAVKYKNDKCSICGYNKYLGTLEFHHLNPNEKDFGVGSKGYTRSWELVKLELDKCILVCSNCHKEIHGGLIKI